LLVAVAAEKDQAVVAERVAEERQQVCLYRLKDIQLRLVAVELVAQEEEPVGLTVYSQASLQQVAERVAALEEPVD
tara:strand:+ start:99 stop:326 length:228 start_codon:yes stop_codon:yes gene_type:complete